MVIKRFDKLVRTTIVFSDIFTSLLIFVIFAMTPPKPVQIYRVFHASSDWIPAAVPNVLKISTIFKLCRLRTLKFSIFPALDTLNWLGVTFGIPVSCRIQHKTINTLKN